MSALLLSLAGDLLGGTVGCLGDVGVGRIDELVIDRHSGRILYVLLDARQGLGASGEPRLAVPWSAFENPEGSGRWRLFLPETIDRLRRAPTFRRTRPPDFANPRTRAEIHTFYGVQP